MADTSHINAFDATTVATDAMAGADTGADAGPHAGTGGRCRTEHSLARPPSHSLRCPPVGRYAL